jgi:hypothetical protein
MTSRAPAIINPKPSFQCLAARSGQHKQKEMQDDIESVLGLAGLTGDEYQKNGLMGLGPVDGYDSVSDIIANSLRRLPEDNPARIKIEKKWPTIAKKVRSA